MKLVSHVFGKYLANKLKYVSMFEALLSSFQNDVEKTLVMQEGCAKASEILEPIGHIEGMPKGKIG